MLNFFDLGKRLTLTDMPGYGFGSRYEWGPMVVNYLNRREQLKVTCLLIDSRRGIMPIDAETIDLLDQGQVPYFVCAALCPQVKLAYLSVAGGRHKDRQGLSPSGPAPAGDRAQGDEAEAADKVDRACLCRELAQERRTG